MAGGYRLQYDCDRTALPGPLGARFLRLELDAEGRAYMERARKERPGDALTRLHRILTEYVSEFDANGLLGIYPMHLLSTPQWRALVGQEPGRRHLDVGAGSGDVTVTLAPLSGQTITTETSWAMARVLARRGFECLRTDVARHGVPKPPYGLITCLNVIDRCAHPRTLLETLRPALAPGGRLVIATPLPHKPLVFDGPRATRPEESLDLAARGWEASVMELIEKVLGPLGLEVDRLARAPYLSGGDAKWPMYALDDAIVVCRRRGD